MPIDILYPLVVNIYIEADYPISVNMSAKLSARERLKLIKRALAGDKITTLCKEVKISRTLLYRWIKRFKENENKLKALTPKLKKNGIQRSVSQDKIDQILKLVKQNPNFSVAKIVENLPKIDGKPIVGYHGVQNVLERLTLNTIEKRIEYQNNPFAIHKEPFDASISLSAQGEKPVYLTNPELTLRPQDRLAMIERVKLGESVVNVCKAYGVSRTIFYRWLKRYEAAPEGKKLEALWDQKPKVEKYYHQASDEYEEAVLAAVRDYPELSSHRLVWVLPQVGGRPILGNHGVQNVYKRNNLSTYEQRLVYSKAYYKQTFTTRFFGIFRGALAFITSKQPASRKTIVIGGLTAFFTIFATVVVWGGSALAEIVFGASSIGLSIGLIFALISLSFGMLFFIYSLKYYLTIAAILSFSRNLSSKGSSIEKNINSNHTIYQGKVGLKADLAKITLDRYPFVSIHLATYNEKRVLDRLLTSATSQEYENYEVILADDSSDPEVLSIIEKWRSHPRIKVVKRETREGFKGGALGNALNKTDPKTEFIIVFDSDFIPYPDTIIQFLKYYKASTGTLDKNKYINNNVAAIQGYQWHVLNKSENWITRGVRSEYAGSYVIERSGIELYSGLKQVSGSVYMIRADVLKQIGWGTSITEDFQLTLKLYEAGYKVVYTPYIQAPAEAVSTLKRLIRQRMRWAEGHSHNIKKMFWKVLLSKNITKREKLEFLYLSPYYLQAFFFILGTLSWFLAEVVFQAKLPFWTSTWGWSLVFTNLLALPLMNMVGLFMEESNRRDYLGLGSFIVLSYILAPFQGYASVKGFLEKQEGPWFRTPKTGKITDVFTQSNFYKLISGLFGKKASTPAAIISTNYLNLISANNQFNSFEIKPKNLAWIGNISLILLLALTTLISSLAPFIPVSKAVYANEKIEIITSNSKPPEKESISSQIINRFDHMESIFHKEPRIRYKSEHYEVELTMLSVQGLGSVKDVESYREGPLFVYPEIFPDADLFYRVKSTKVQESLVLKKYQPVDYIEQRLRLTNLVITRNDKGDVFFAPKDGGNAIFNFDTPFMYEQNDPDKKNWGITYELEDKGGEYILKKTLNEEGKAWLVDPNRQFPVVIDPTIVRSNVVASGMAAGETEYGSNHRKIAYMPNATGGAAWYAFHADGGIIRYKKCFESSLCDADNDWSANVSVDVNADAGDGNPTIWVEGDSIWIAWIDNATVGGSFAIDSVQFRKLDTTNDSFNTQCSSADQGTIDLSNFAYIATGDNGDIVVGYSDTAGDSEADLWEVATGGCTFSSIESTSGMPASSTTMRPVPLGLGNKIHIIYDDAANEIRHSVRDVSTNAWDFTDKVADNGAVSDDIFSVTTDGSSLWLLYSDTTTTTVLQKCAATCNSSSTWSNLTAPWTSGLTTSDYPTIGYTSTENDLKACIIDGANGTSEDVICKSTDATTISWGSQFSIGFTAADFAQLTLTQIVSSDTQLALVIHDVTNSTFKFATVPEKALILLIFTPLLPGILKKLKKTKKV